eukprot:CAMPEP_0196570880 /NCGR_PEP_ID=MMETSP1081-20130531/1047_1 /TAXON_ID=36882 /ORGANISM="Pyramimonas amylifera, Strain CCMP720" /LENGTH=405 /DNA_ID=CAMNT_0041887561 /DNA_START=61 /DNA_END=1278 /DNA_ORIENTATION=-
MAFCGTLHSARLVAPSPVKSQACHNKTRVSFRSKLLVVAKANGKVLALGSLVGGMSLGALPAFALDADELAANIKRLLDFTQDGAEKATQTAEILSSKAKEAVDIASPVVKKSLDTASPVVKKFADDAVKSATPYVQQGAEQARAGLERAGGAAQYSLTRAGVDFEQVDKVTKTASETAKSAAGSFAPTVQKVSESALGLESTQLALAALVLGGVLFSTPIWIPLLLSSFRGYTGDISPARALDFILQDDTLLVDLRSSEEVLARGRPEVPARSNFKVAQVPVLQVLDGRLRDQMTDASDVETQNTALVVSNLKRASKGTSLLLLDKNGSRSKDVAKVLSRMGFQRVFVIDGGFQGWAQSKLPIREGNPISATGSMKIFGTQLGSTKTRADSQSGSGRQSRSGRV